MRTYFEEQTCTKLKETEVTACNEYAVAVFSIGLLVAFIFV